jgi:predicted ATP-grasp superfamily ATP-dependent carboligase
LDVASADVLQALLPRLAATDLGFLAQELVPGSEDRIESYHVYVDEEGEVVGEFTGRKIRTYPPRFGISSALTTTTAEDVAAVGREVIDRLALRGVAKLDFKRGPDGKLWLLEVNPRFTLWTHLGAVAGVNLPALAYADLTGAPRPAVGAARPGVRWVWPRADAASARAEGVPLARWALWALSCETNAAFAWTDARPYVWGRLGRPLLLRARAALMSAVGSR